MGTVTAIGATNDDDSYTGRLANIAAANTTLTSSFVNYPRTAVVTLDDWDTAIQFAVVVARQHDGVKVSKVIGQWQVSWTESHQTYQPQPSVKPYVYPYTVTYRSGNNA